MTEPHDPSPANGAGYARREPKPKPPPIDFVQPQPEATDPFAPRWVRLADHPEMVTEGPPPQRWLLERSHGARTVGVLPRGRCGLLVGRGGVSKTYALIQLGVAVAAGGHWLGTFRVAEPGHVLLALAEEDLAEAQRRLWRTLNTLGLSRAERIDVASRIDLLPLAGQSVELTCAVDRGLVVETPAAELLRRHLGARGVAWALVAIDPLSRWAGGGAERDNEAATRFVQTMETFTAAPGDPTVLGAHHSAKAAARDGNADARGVSALHDGFRFVMALDPVEQDGQHAVRLRNTKNNYTLAFEDMLLVREDEPGIEGTLRPASTVETDELRPPDPDETASTRRRARVESDAAAVLEVIRAQPGIATRDLIAAASTQGLSRDRTYAGLAALADRIERRPGKRDSKHHYLRGQAP